jgi:hypothetical protein
VCSSRARSALLLPKGEVSTTGKGDIPVGTEPPTGSNLEHRDSAGRSAWSRRAASAVRTAGQLLAGACDSPAHRVMIIGTAGLIAWVISRTDRR